MKIFLLTACCFLVSWVRIEGSIFTVSNATVELSDEVVLEKWKALLGKLKGLTDDVLKTVLPMAVRLTSEVDISTECQGTLLKLVFAIRKGDYWAIQMLDSSGKPFSGLTQGTISDLGSYHGCLEVHSRNEYSADIRGQYCLLDLRPPLPKKPDRFYLGEIIEPFQNLSRLYNNPALTELLSYVSQLYKFPIRVGLCIPSTCTREDIQNIASYAADQIGFYADVPSCEMKTPLTFEVHQLAILSLFGLFGFVVAFATIFDISMEYFENWQTKNLDDPKKPHTSSSKARYIVESCSIRRNLPALMNCERKERLGFLNGVRVLAMFIILVAHVHANQQYHALREPRAFSDQFDILILQPLINSRLNVDTFVFISALLFSYLTLSNQGKVGTRILTQIILIIRRIWRLQPLLFIVIGFVILSPLIGSGPLWKESLDDVAAKCTSDWWKSLLFLNNIYPINDICLPISWYVSMDMQLFVISCVIYILYTRVKIAAYIVLGALYILSVVPIFVFTIVDYHSHPPTLNLRYGDPQQIFIMTANTGNVLHLHLGVYVTGLITGAILAKKSKMSIPWGCRTTAWILMFAGYGLINLTTGQWATGHLPEPLVAAFYAATFRIVWSLGLAWLSIACYYGYGGYIEACLSWNAFIPLSRLTYVWYLIHLPIFDVYNASTNGVVDYRHTVEIFASCAVALISLIVSVFMYLIFECPLKLVDKLLFSNVLRKEQKSDSKVSGSTTKL